ncbi:biotin carboxylase N-terminal domain-containing protein [Ferrovibrio sp.]|uniref:acetyl-CoA carboxylase biotin carboxylase subunit n=1 Tax=Ferrovibrio sp. TaxID=1917215 RepID=UPI001B64DCF2|nr:biotin carboxylase N-terminal domain-containing protein [Ferrovibrio sp.]MBP7063156.1 biotin carboxylase [Ferrovibrio sp.]
MSSRPISTLLVANRGAAAIRVIRAAKAMGLRSVAVYSEADADLPYLALADQALPIGGAAPRESYLNQDNLLAAMRESGADALHPGYGFLSENAEFAAKVAAMGAVFVGPSPHHIDAMGHKARARDLMAQHGMPVSASSAVLGEDAGEIAAAGAAIGYPVMVKPAGGGGGIGMLAARDEAELLSAVSRARSMASRSFGVADIYLEKLLLQPRHIEFQILADRAGNAMHVFERDCSVQRRHQKVIEEAPAPGLARAVTRNMAGRVAGIMGAMRYDVIGTVETLHSASAGFGFLEVNTRLQVEHAVTEAVTGLDLVRCQIRLATGEALADVVPVLPEPQGHAIQARIYAEDPVRFLPSPGPLTVFRLGQGEGIRIETGYAEGNIITPYYDPMIAKVIAHGADRAEAIQRLDAALAASRIEGVKTNIPLLRAILAFPAFQAGTVHTGLVADVLAAQKAAA